MTKVLLDRMCAAAALVLLLPLWFFIAVAIAWDDGLPILFRQTRIGRGNVPFQLLKFRSMRPRVPGPRITAGNDPRLTRVGAFLRRFKLDELPQLWNVLKGDMSLVGPRPEVPAFVDFQDPTWQTVLQVRPGITDLASLVYRNEEEILCGQNDPESYYRNEILPAKLALNMHYLRSRSLWSDLKIILITMRYSFFPAGFHSSSISRMFLKQENS
ncbi:MAG TPA: sugar transferase [Bryobacterales bacterium]|jgi:lipopolysaccharide/colanic/teichoic acid biosynthesis glycosyltransferase|nr:sugar transferase [Bryobacterales bacterium]